ncbi:P-type conjugative transfer protein TrbL [Sphingobium sp. DEHP117]|uniref:P-type conjugative transfer protein TrbL n=1 Tax=Sphingobium sp. DEHP117 TaxID=2993436 RepID=UPI0027D72681|nr:P-type conjugative transfer protein TrbL [Sphingobium sp. DEHP117]MDQ4422173.1 P-type conjugative transfer protein TrbL [Sphingobium sp. DEHP117]
MAVTTLMSLALATPASAQAVQQSAVLDQIVAQYQAAASSMGSNLQSFATHLFGVLAGIEFAWAMITCAINQADIRELVAEIVKRIMFIGVGFWIVSNGIGFGGNIISSWNILAGAASSAVPSGPASILDEGLNIVDIALANLTWTDISGSLAIIIAAIIVLIALGLVAAQYMLVIIEANIIINIGVIILGFLGFRWSHDIGRRYIVSIIAIGAKLFVLKITLGLGFTVINTLVTGIGSVGPTQLLKAILILLGVAVTFAFLVQRLPTLIEGVMAGASLGGNSGIANAAGITGAAAAAVGAASARASVVAAQAVRTTRSSGGFAPSGIGGVTGAAMGLARGMGLSTMATVKALATAAAGKAMKTPGSTFGGIGGQALSKLQNLQTQAKAANAQPGGGSNSGGSNGGGSTPQPYISPLNKGS